MKHNTIAYLLMISMVLIMGVNTYAQEKNLELPQAVDISVNGIILHHPESTLRIVGDNLHPTNLDNGSSSLVVINQDKTQCLTLIFHPGGERYTCIFERTLSS